MSGTFIVNNEKYHVALADRPFSGEILNPLIRFKATDERFVGLTNGVGVVPYRLGDHLYLDDRIYMFDRVSMLGDSLVLKYIGKAASRESIGFNIGDCIPEMSFTTIGGDRLNTWNENGQYTVYNFWGSWCHACGEGMPRYVSIFSRYNNENVRFIGIGVEESIDDAVEFINRHNMTWPQVHENFSDIQNAGLTKLLRVEVFP